MTDLNAARAAIRSLYDYSKSDMNGDWEPEGGLDGPVWQAVLEAWAKTATFTCTFPDYGGSDIETALSEIMDWVDGEDGGIDQLIADIVAEL